ncbi:MAG: ABC transporter ATP-binding protein [Sneathiellales bacterium]|nr:ABC transporter ATP-binding protein [Sneathiellales bacterium]
MTLELTKISVIFGKSRILENLSTSSIESGKLVGVLGANGVGKSTLLKAVAGQQPYSGQVLFKSQALAEIGAHQRNSFVSYMPQNLPQATSLVAYEAVLSAVKAVDLGLKGTQAEMLVEEVFEILHLSPLAFRSLDAMSGGQRQLVGLAQVIVRKPSLLLLDEPTSALDLNWQIRVLEVLKKLVQEQKSISLIAMHDINLALRHCDWIILLSKGKVLSEGIPETVMTEEFLEKAYGIKGRVETCSRGTPFVIADGICSEV